MRHTSLLTSLLAIFLLLLSSGFAVAQLSFSASGYPDSSNFADQSLGVTSGDFNHDGMPDLAVSVGSTGTGTGMVSVLLATTPGHFGSHMDHDLGETPGAIATADVDGDGQLDLVVAVPQQNRIAILLGNGNGTFRDAPDLPAAARPTSIALGDFNGDQLVDIAVVECQATTPGCSLAVFLSNGDGTFRMGGVLASTDVRLNGLVAIDFNRDGHLDLATAEMGPSRALVYFGNGDGTFSGPTAVVVNNPIPADAGESLPNVAAADFNDDGTPDLAVLAGTVCGSACGGDTVHILISNADKTFTEKSSFRAWGNGGGGYLVASDFNGDMHQDLLYFNGDHFGGGNAFFLGHGDGTFSPVSSNFNGGDISDFMARDLNLDSRHDLVETSWMENSAVVGLNAGAAVNCPPTGGGTRITICSRLRTAERRKCARWCSVPRAGRWQLARRYCAHGAVGGRREAVRDLERPAQTQRDADRRIASAGGGRRRSVCGIWDHHHHGERQRNQRRMSDSGQRARRPHLLANERIERAFAGAD